MWIVDSHEDLAWNILTFGRDYTRPVQETRRLEKGSLAVKENGDTMLGWPEYVQGGVALVFATLFLAPARYSYGSWDIQCYSSSDDANRKDRAQLDAYERLVEKHPDKFRLIKLRGDLEDLLQACEHPGSAGRPVGLMALMEDAEGVRSPAELEEWWERGLRVIGPAWASNRFTGGTKEPGPLTKEGFALLEAMGSLGFALDISHMDEPAVLQSLDVYPAQVIASHANAGALIKDANTNRHLSDRVIRDLIERDGVIGVVPYNKFLKRGWQKGDPRHGITLKHVVAHIDYICQLAGDACHVGIGTDFDGGFGLQSSPEDIDSIADLTKLIPMLEEKGYSQEDIAAILGGNWLSRVRKLLPESL